MAFFKPGEIFEIAGIGPTAKALELALILNVANETNSIMATSFSIVTLFIKNFAAIFNLIAIVDESFQFESQFLLLRM